MLIKLLKTSIKVEVTRSLCLGHSNCEVMNFEAGSEVIMSAINIPDMVTVVKHHNLKVVPWDISIETTEPKLDLLPSLITSHTVAILVAHIFGKWCDMDPIIDVAQSYNLPVIEDCAESFCGFDVIGNPRSDLVLFSFGVIKFSTAFGGAIAKIKDESVYKKMLEVYGTYRVQGHGEFLKKIFKYYLVYLILLPFSEKILISAARFFGIDHKAMAVQMLRGFPDQMTQRIKMRPSSALLQMLRERLEGFSKSDFETGQVKGDYVRMRLPEEAQMVGMKAIINNYWLFPILVESPDTVLSVLNALGVDAYRGATQLNIIEPETSPNSDDPMTPIDPSYPSEARYLIDHVVYLPVNKKVPFHVLNKICNAVKEAIRLSKDSPKVRIQSKL
ncbi:GDPPS-like protein [Mya arenaria]|uniref:GDPPS-like protein n=1 Tax=Mya arenaria TaxID=6604 RepID=A0ABY7EL41_MYAAR|nr:GDPPS-like protein [Mya arenaria]